jgi:hypothetical protein
VRSSRLEALHHLTFIGAQSDLDEPGAALREGRMS